MTVLAHSHDDPPTEVLRRCGRSFHWAARLLPREARADASRLYAACRRIDDLGDLGEPDAAARELDAIDDALARRDPARPIAAALLDLADRRGLSLAAARTLVAGVRRDIDAPAIATTAELIRYCYRVAGTVGLMMCPILGVRAPAHAQPFAIDLGIAMQLTNIARDVAEDAANGRRYLPTAILGAAVPPAVLANPDAATRARVYEAVLQVLNLADAYYRSAERGMGYIPARPRLGILTASRIYAGIAERIRAAGPEGYWRARAIVPASGKATRTLSALVAFAGTPSLPHPRAPGHDRALHVPIAALPGANPAAVSGGIRT